jgi:hypothetical protein
MDWQLIKRHSDQFNKLLAGEIGINEVDPEVNHAMAFICYGDAEWVTQAPKEERKLRLERVPETVRDDVAAMAKLIIKGEI